MTCGIYLINSTFDGRVYVGSSVNVERRIAGHKWDLTHQKHGNIKLQRFVNKYGISSLTFNILESCRPKKSILIAREQHYIDVLKPSFNICQKAGTVLGIKRTREAIERVRKALIGRKCPWTAEANKKRLGIKLTEEHKRSIGLGNLGKKAPKLAEYNRSRRGRSLSVNHRRKLAIAGKGQLRPHLHDYNQRRKCEYLAQLFELRGDHYGTLTVIRPEYKNRAVLKCRCSCGKHCFILPHRWQTHGQYSCGCRKGRLR